jgi:hypothetical protein
MTPGDVAGALRRRVEETVPRLRGITEEAASRPREPGKWSPKELLGHLIDSATNNHNRFVRGILDPEVRLPKYEQEGWVRAQRYSGTEWGALIDFWRLYNLHLARVIEGIPADRVEVPCRIGDNPPMTLGDLAADYVLHLEHHIRQVLP